MKAQELKEAMKGIVGISITPMNKDLQVDEEGFRRHIQFLMSKGITKENGVLVITGSTGECGALSVTERKRILEMVLEEAGDNLPIIAGCNHSNVNEVIELVQHAERAGAAGVMILPPYYYVPTDEAILQFYQQVSEHSEIGIMLYNNFEVTHKDIPLPVLRELSEKTNVVGIKECTPNFVKMERVARELGDKMAIINGHGEFLEPFAALAGTAGFISSTANFAPEIAVEMWKARSDGDFVKAKKIRDRLTPYLDLAGDMSAQGGEPKVLAILKKATDLVGSCGGPGRLPLCALSTEEVARISDMLKTIGLI